MPELPADAMARGSSSDVKLIIGTNLDEGTLFLRMKNLAYTWELVEKMCKQNGYEDKLPELRKLYADRGSLKYQLNLLNTDRGFRIDSIKAADAQSQYNDVWMYRFDYATRLTKLLGFKAKHALEVLLTCNNLGKGQMGKLWFGNSRKDTLKLRDDMNKAWVNFAKTGDPNGNLDITWEKYNANERQTMLFNRKNKLEENPEKENFRIWEEIKLYTE